MIDKQLNKIIDMHAEALDKAKDIVVEAHNNYSARAWIGAGASLGAIVCAIAAGFLLRDFGKRNFEYMPDMSYSEAWESQTQHDYRVNYPESYAELPPHIQKWGTADMAPPDGTVRRGQRILDMSASDEGRARAGRELANPYASAEGEELKEVLARGKKLLQYKCQACHGVDGVGSAPVTKYGIGAPAIDTKTIQAKWNDGELFHIISFGYNNESMPAYANQIDYDDRWKIIRYLRSVQEGKK